MSKRIARAASAVAGVVALLAALTLFGLLVIQQQARWLASEPGPSLLMVAESGAALSESSRAIRELLFVSDPDAKRAQLEILAAASRRTDDLVERVRHATPGREAQAALARLELAYVRYGKARDELVAHVKSGQVPPLSDALVRELGVAEGACSDRLKELARVEDARTTDRVPKIVPIPMTARVALASLMAAALLVALSLAASALPSRAAPLGHATTSRPRVAADRPLAEGNQGGGTRGRGVRHGAGHAMGAQARAALRSASDGASDGAAHPSPAIAPTGQALPSGAVQPYLASSSGRQSAPAPDARDETRSAAANKAAQEGNSVRENVKKLADVIGIVDGIAFQTNILALNAALEAARAPDQEGAFAAVALEVRGLANRSSEAAREIKELMAASVHRDDQGSALLHRAGPTMREAVVSLRRVTEIVAEISRTNADEKGAPLGAAPASGQGDQFRHDAGLVAQYLASAESLRAQAQQLIDAVALFKPFGPPGTRS